MNAKEELHERLRRGIAQAAAGTTRDLGSFSHYLDDATCVDSDGEAWPEHDYPPVGEGNECRRCYSEVED